MRLMGAGVDGSLGRNGAVRWRAENGKVLSGKGRHATLAVSWNTAEADSANEANVSRSRGPNRLLDSQVKLPPCSRILSRNARSANGSTKSLSRPTFTPCSVLHKRVSSFRPDKFQRKCAVFGEHAPYILITAQSITNLRAPSPFQHRMCLYRIWTLPLLKPCRPGPST